MSDLISRQDLLDKFEPWLKVKDYNDGELNMLKAILYEIRFAPELSTNLAEVGTELISRQAAIDAIKSRKTAEQSSAGIMRNAVVDFCIDIVKKLPSAQPEKEKAKRVLWTGWKGHRDTRYKCPNCKKPVKNDDIYCHRCGQKLMFPHISFTDYVPGEKQETIVRWDDE